MSGGGYCDFPTGDCKFAHDRAAYQELARQRQDTVDGLRKIQDALRKELSECREARYPDR